MIHMPHLPHKILFPVLGLAILLTIIGGAWAFSPKDGDSQAPTPAATPGPIQISGEIVCLPHKGDGPHTAECAFGLRTDDDTHYSLRGLDQNQLIDGVLTVQTRVSVRGSVMPPEEKEKYDIAGAITIENIEVIQASS